MATPPLGPTRDLISQRVLARVGTTIQGKYRINRLLGVGGMAAVYAGVHRNGHRVAFKFLLEHLLRDSDIYRLFVREAYVANQVGHPGAVSVLDDDVDEDGSPFLIMPLLEGETLRARWERAGKRLPLEEVSVFMLDVLDVLAAAHAKGIVHRDCKPENLFVTTKGEVRVLDFGIARRSEGDGGTTVTGRMIGTPAFMPPEQALGESQKIGPHSDLWAVGATIFALLSGEYVHRAEGGAAQWAAATRKARSLAEAAPAMPNAIVGLVDKALAFAPEERWASAREMAEALTRVTEETWGESVATGTARVRAALGAELLSRIVDDDVKETQPPQRAVPIAPHHGATDSHSKGTSRTLDKFDFESSRRGIAPTLPAGGSPPPVRRHAFRRVTRLAGISLLVFAGALGAVEYGRHSINTGPPPSHDADVVASDVSSSTP